MAGRGNPFEGIVPFLKALPFIFFVVGAIIITVIWLRRKHKERLGELGGMTTVNATVVYKRRDVRRDINSAPYDERYSNTNFYYVTFEEKSGNKLELLVSGEVYDSVRRGESGVLSYRGLRFLEFLPQKRA
ncbi:MAG: DUF2500 domain-containing protein [Oscillospiraceae bacterium]|nr:DUF2500 domain-containing protein [Oscillospiraceae bacterium]